MKEDLEFEIYGMGTFVLRKGYFNCSAARNGMAIEEKGEAGGVISNEDAFRIASAILEHLANVPKKK